MSLIVLHHPASTELILEARVTDAEESPVIITSAAALDTQLDQDGGGFGAATNEWTEIGATGVYRLTITAAERGTYTTLFINSITSTAGAKLPQFLILQDELGKANVELAGIPTTVSSLRQLIQYVFETFRNKSTMNKNTGVETLYKEDASTPLGDRTHTNDGTTWTKPEMS